MKRISLTIDSDILEKLDAWVKNFELEHKGNRSGYIASLIKKHTPELPS